MELSSTTTDPGKNSGSSKSPRDSSVKKRKNRNSAEEYAFSKKTQVTGDIEYEHNHKKLVKCLIITMLIELSVFGSNLTCVAMTPWFHDCQFYNGEIYSYFTNLTEVGELLPNNGRIPAVKQKPSECSQGQSLAYCTSKSEVNLTLQEDKEQEVIFTCRCTEFYDTVTLWDEALTFHDSISEESVAWPVRGLILFAVILKFLVTFEYFICLVSKKMRESACNYMVKFCSSWLSGAFLLGSTMHISFSDYSKMCGKFGIGFWTMVVSFIMLVPSMIGVLFSAGYFVHLRTLKMEMRQK